MSVEHDENHGKGRKTGFAGEKELRALATWFAQEPSDAKGWRVLNELTLRTLDRIEMDPSARCFTTEDLCDWAVVDCSGDVWRDVKRWWDCRRLKVREAMRIAGSEFEPKLSREGGGGRGNKAVSMWRMEPMDDKAAAEVSAHEDDVSLAAPAPVGDVLYRRADYPPVKVSNWLLRRLFRDGQMNIGSSRHNILRLNLLGSTLFLLLFSLAVVVLMFIHNRAVGTRDLGLLGLIAIGGLMWWQKWRPIIYAREDRITPLPEEWLPLKAAPAQLERKRTDGGEVLRLVRYAATCPICGGDIHLASGAPEWRRRTVGRCADAPREHVFSFDPVLQSGKRL
ncbi:MAG: hypothetical protein KDB14_34410 [Planctomycetales bacterium]|nr:hypothetical protein [Planctomycetales bacterium]